jgi:hypothetical protein
LRAGTAETLGLFGAGKAAFGSLIGDDEMVASGMQYYQDKMREAEAFAGDVDQLEEIDLFDEGGFGRATDYLAYTFGRVLPSIATSIAGGGVTGALGYAAAKGLVKESAEAAAQELLKRKTKDQAEKEINEFLADAIRDDLEGSLAKEAGQRYAQNVAARTARRAGITGAFATSTTMNTGEVFAKIYEREGVEAPVVALVAGTASGALDTFATPFRVINKILPDKLDPLRKHVVERLSGDEYSAVANRIVSEALKTGGIEAGTEALQEIISDTAADFVNNNFTDDEKVQYLTTLTTEEGRSRLYNAAAAGFIGGFSVGGAVSTATEAPGVVERVNEDRLRRMEGFREDAADALDEAKTTMDRPITPVTDKPARVADVEFEGETTEPSTPVFERIKSINENAGAERTQVEGDDTFQAQEFGGSAKLVTKLQNPNGPSVEGTVLPNVQETFPSDRIDDNPNAALISNVFLDLVERGMPVQFLDDIQGIHTFDPSHALPADAEAASFPVSKTLAFRQEVIEEAAQNPAVIKRIAANFAHEAWHQADNQNKYTDNIPELEMSRLDPDGDLYNVRLGSVMDELFLAWENGTEIGKKFGYPLNDFHDQLVDAKTEQEQNAVIRTTKREMFAQLGSVFLASPRKLKNEAPNAYNLIKSIRDNPMGIPTEAQDVGTTDQTSVETPAAPGVLPEVRAPPIEGSSEVQDGGGVGGTGDTGVTGQPTSRELGEETLTEDGDAPGRVLPEQQRVLDLIENNQGVTVNDIALELDESTETVTGLLNELETQNLVQTDMTPDGVFYSTEDTPDLVRVPTPEEQAPVLPMGKIEQSIQDLLNRTDNNPTARQLRNLTGAPTPRKGKEKLDKNVKPRTLEELRGFMREAQKESKGLEWYDEFGRFFRDLVGDANLDEASVVFGVTSAQNSAEQNLADTLHIMALARKTNPAENPKQFALAVKNTPRPGGQKLKITGKQIDKIVAYYNEGALEGGIKTTTYMQMVADRGRNEFNPFSVQDVHMSRVFGFNMRDVDKKTGEVVDAAKFPSDNAYRYGQFLTSVLADEFGVTPNQAQALLWFYAKTNLSPKKGGKPGTFESAQKESAAEIEVIRELVADGTFDTANPVTPALAEPSTPRAKPATQEGFTNVDEKQQLVELAAARAPKVIVSAIPGVDRGLAFSEDTTIEQLTEYNDAVLDAITDDDGQIPYLRELNVPHQIERAAGSFTGYEPAITIRLLGSNMSRANELAPLLGDALLQDSVLTFQPQFAGTGLTSFMARKSDGSDITTEEGQVIAEVLNPANDPDGLNFNQPLPNTILFLDPKSFDDSTEYTVGMSKEFYATLTSQLELLSNELGSAFDVTIVRQDSNYFEHTGYQEVIERARGAFSAKRRSDLQNLANDTLYEPTRRVYEEYSKRYGLREESVDPGTPSPPARADVGINVRTDGALNYAQLIVSGEKKFESRTGNSLRPYVGKRVGIIETGSGPAKLVGFATVGEPTQVNAKEFAEARDQHLVPEGSRFDIQPGQTKLLYEMIDPQPLAEPIDASGTKGIVARDISQLPAEPTPDESGEFIKRTFDDSTPSASYNLQDQAVVQNDLQRVLEGNAPFYKSIVDKFMDFKELERRIAENLGMEKLPASMSFYDQENLMHGKVAEDLANLEKDFVEPIAKLAEAAGVDAEAVGLYLLAKHAPERNAVIAEKNRKLRAKQVEAAEKAGNEAALQTYAETPIPFQDGGSGITTAQAEGILAKAEEDGLTPQMEEIAGKVYQMLDEFRQRMVDQRLLDEDSRLDWESTYQFYVPLKGFAAEPDSEGNYQASSKTRGFSITGSESLKARGRASLPQNPLLVSFMDVEAKMVRGRKNEVANTLYDMLRAADSAVGGADKHDAWKIYTNKNRPKSQFDAANPMSLSEMKQATRKDGAPRFVQVKRGGQTYFIEFKDNELNKTAHRLGEQAFSNLVGLLDTSVSFFGGFQNLRRNFLINYNPTFMLANPVRDIEASLVYLLGESEAAGSRTNNENIAIKVARLTPAAGRAYVRHATGRTGKTEKARELDQFTKEYFEDGAPTGITLTRSYDEQIKRINNLVGQKKWKQALKKVGDAVELGNQASENMIRLATYVEARKAGAAREDAATLAKDVTVNFNRKGEQSEAINLGYLFFNAAMQGNTNIFQALGRKGYKAKAAAVGFLGIGYATTIMNILFSDEDEDGEPIYADYTESSLKRTINILGSDGTGIAIPMAYGFGFFTNIGRYMAEYQHGIKDEYEVSAAIAQNVVDNFSPVAFAEGDNIFEQGRGFLPDVFEYAADMAVNKNFFGSPIQYEQLPMGAQRADSYASKRATNANLKLIAEWLNDTTGGSEYLPADDPTRGNRLFGLDWSPDRMDYTIQYFFGGLGRVMGDVADVTTKMVVDPEDIKPEDRPVLSYFYKKPSDYADRMEFYDNSSTMKQVVAELQKQIALGTEQGNAYREREAALVGLIPEHAATLQGLDAFRQQRKFVEKENESVSEVRKRKEEIEKNENELFDSFNKKFRAAIEERNQ